MSGAVLLYGCNTSTSLVLSPWILTDPFRPFHNTANSFVMSVRPHGTTRLPLDGHSLNLLLEYFSKICLEISSFIKIGQE